MSAPTPTDPRALALEAASDPVPASVERGPIARLHWRHGLDIDADLAATVVDTPETPREWSAILAETHAALLDPSGSTPLERPSPLGTSVADALQRANAWPTLADAARAHPMIAREAVTALADVVLDALRKSGAKPATDTRRSLADLEAARAKLEATRAAQAAAKTSEEKRETSRAVVAALEAEERADAAVAVDNGVSDRAGDYIDAASDDGAIEAIARHAEEQAEANHVFSAALGSGTGVGGQLPLPDDVVKRLTKDVTRVMLQVGALRAALSAGRSARHVRGLEGVIGPTHGGLDRVADLTSLAQASLAGHLGAAHASLTRLALVEGRADVVEKGGGIARNGHVLVVLDKSSSMRGARETWAAAVAITVILEARSDGRSCALVTYSGAVKASIVVDSAATLAQAVFAALEESRGSNNEHAALVEAVKCLGKMPHGGDPADVLMITDGQWVASNMDGTGIERARLRGCFIGGAAPVGAGFASTWSVQAAEGPDGMVEAVIVAGSVV